MSAPVSLAGRVIMRINSGFPKSFVSLRFSLASKELVQSFLRYVPQNQILLACRIVPPDYSSLMRLFTLYFL